VVKEKASFCPECGTTIEPVQKTGPLPARGTPGHPRVFYRSSQDKMIAGVCGGLGMYFNIDPILVRIAFVTLFFTGYGLLAYVLLWLFTPVEQS